MRAINKQIVLRNATGCMAPSMFPMDEASLVSFCMTNKWNHCHSCMLRVHSTSWLYSDQFMCDIAALIPGSGYILTQPRTSVTGARIGADILLFLTSAPGNQDIVTHWQLLETRAEVGLTSNISGPIFYQCLKSISVVTSKKYAKGAGVNCRGYSTETFPWPWPRVSYPTWQSCPLTVPQQSDAAILALVQAE